MSVVATVVGRRTNAAIFICQVSRTIIIGIRKIIVSCAIGRHS